MTKTHDHLLLVGFGGPRAPEEVMPFLERLTRGAEIPPARLKEVARHYEESGGFSPYNQHAARLVEALRRRLRDQGAALPIFLGMRNWHPFLEEVLPEIRGKGLKHGLAVVLAPHRSEASFDRYRQSLEKAVGRPPGEPPRYAFPPPWHAHPLFIEAQAQRIREVLETVPPSERGGIHLLFTAHSIPSEMAAASSYEQEIRLSSQMTAKRVGSFSWSVAYQSRSGPPQQAWLEPDVPAALRALKGEGRRAALVVPIGFLFDHTEVLYDLDLQAREEARRLGLRFSRASTVMDHPRFIQMLAELTG